MVAMAKLADLDGALDAAAPTGEVRGADLKRAIGIGTRLAQRARLAPGMEAPQRLGAEDRARALRAQAPNGVLDEATHVKDEGVEVAAEGAVEDWRRSEAKAQDSGAAGVEVQRRPLDLDEAGLPQAEVEEAHRHVLGAGDEPGGDTVDGVVDEAARLGLGVHEAGPVGLAVVEELVGGVVPALAEQRVKSAAQVAVKAPGEFGQRLITWRHARVVVGDEQAREVHVDVRVPLGIGQRVEPDLLDHRVPGREEGLAQRGTPHDGRRGAGNDDARWGHGGWGSSRPVPDAWSRSHSAFGGASGAAAGGPPAAATQTRGGGGRTFVHDGRFPPGAGVGGLSCTTGGSPTPRLGTGVAGLSCTTGGSPPGACLRTFVHNGRFLFACSVHNGRFLFASDGRFLFASTGHI